MAERFEKLFSLPPNLYSKGSPVIISAGSLLKDTETGKIIVQIKFHSVSFTHIKALKIDIAAYDVSGKEIEGVNDYQYLDLKINNGEEFGSNKAIVLPNTVARSFSINNISVVFSNGSTVNMLFPLKALPGSKTLVSELSNVELARQYQLKTNKNATYVPFVLDELWFCSCGSWNSNHICTNCGLNKEKAIENLDVSRLEPEMNTRLQAEKIERIQQQELAEKKVKEEQILREKNKKKKRSIAILATIAIVLFVGALIYSSQHKFDDIAGVYALCNLEEAEKALYEFQEDSIDEYGFNPYSYEIEIKGSGKVYGLWFVNNRGSMTPRAATVKSVSKDGVVEFDVLDYPDAEVNLTVDIETGEATYSSRNLTLDYRRITEELAENGYKEYSSKEIGKDISFVQDLFELNSANKILKKYKDATAEDAKYNVKIEGAFCGAEGTYQIWELDGIYRIIFEQGIYDTNTEKENLIEALNSVFGEYKYSSSFEAYTWKSTEYNMQIDYWPHKGIYFFRNAQESNTTAKTITFSDGCVSIEKGYEEYAEYDNNIWEYTINTYGDDSCCWFWHDDTDDDIDDMGQVKTHRGIILGESTKSDVIVAYGESDVEMSFDKTTDILYRSMKASGESSYKYLNDTKTVLAYDYESQYQIVFYVNDTGTIDFILYTSGIWYED